jgi:hypothetical protein
MVKEETYGSKQIADLHVFSARTGSDLCFDWISYCSKQCASSFSLHGCVFSSCGREWKGMEVAKEEPQFAVRNVASQNLFDSTVMYKIYQMRIQMNSIIA